MDDGIPTSGGVRIWDFGNNGCDNLTNGSAGIDESIESLNCSMFFVMH